MSQMKPSYSVEFKNEAASLVLDKRYSIKEACTFLKQLTVERGGQTPTANALTTEQQTIQSLKARIIQIEWENGILKKANALLVSDTIKR